MAKLYTIKKSHYNRDLNKFPAQSTAATLHEYNKMSPNHSWVQSNNWGSHFIPRATPVLLSRRGFSSHYTVHSCHSEVRCLVNMSTPFCFLRIKTPMWSFFFQTQVSQGKHQWCERQNRKWLKGDRNSSSSLLCFHHESPRWSKAPKGDHLMLWYQPIRAACGAQGQSGASKVVSNNSSWLRDSKWAQPRMHMIPIWTMRECGLVFEAIGLDQSPFVFPDWTFSKCSFRGHITYFP